MSYFNLLDKVLIHNKKYYDESAPIISDAEYDALYDELLEIEKKQGWTHPNSPTLKVGGNPGKVQHKYKLYSMKKVYDAEEVEPSFKVKTPKIDGTNLTVTYSKGKLFLGLTRGDGSFGDSVNHLLPYIKGLPSVLNTDKEEIIITGECVTDNSEVKNFRNYVSGALGLKDAEEFKSRNIRFIVHDWLGEAQNYIERLQELSNLGFNTVLDEEFCSKYPQDGIIYRLDNYKASQELGYTSKYPRFAVALKSREILVAQSILKSVEWDVGRTGTVNPVGIIDPVEIDDATITRLTLHNIEFIEQLNLGIGDKVEIERAGGVIPKMLRVLEHSPFSVKVNTKHAEDAIGGETIRVGPKLFVKDQEKHGTVKLLQHFVSNMEIKGLGLQSIRKMGLTHPSDLYKPQKWVNLGANGAKIKEEIERSKLQSYSIVLSSLGIPGVGRSMSDKIVKELHSFDKLPEIEYVTIPGIGEVMREKILVWYDNNSDWVKELPLRLEQDLNDVLVFDSSSLRKVCISGKLDMTKQDLGSLLNKYNFKLSETVTKDCYALIVADKNSNSSKAVKAQQYGIKIIDYWSERTNILKGVL